MTTPQYLNKGDKITIIAPAGKILKEKVETALSILQGWGLEFVTGSHLFSDHYQYAATDNERLADLQQALDDPSVKAILFARGGYGAIRIVDRVNWSGFRKHTKWLIGFSDITIFHSHVHRNFGIETLHGPMAAGLADPTSAETLRKVLFGEPMVYTFDTHSLSKQGKAQGELVGGNLAILCSLIGSASDIETKGNILFLEDVGEYLYRLDRMMWQMKRSGKLSQLKGLIVGGMTEMKDGDTLFGKTAYEIVSEAVSEYDYPVCFGFPAGHKEDNRALILGRKVNLVVNNISTLNFQP
jgi:muramoyltetrapeptide carboxypeptidase